MYRELKQKQQEEFNKFPMRFAFSKSQFEEGMKELGLGPNDIDKVYSYGDSGGFYKREDNKKLFAMLKRFDDEMNLAIDSDPNGEGFIYDMFLYELDNHEYGYTYSLGDTLDALGLELEEIKKDIKLYKGLKKAIDEIKAR